MDIKLKYKVWVGEKHADIAHKLMDSDIETFALEFAEHLVKNCSISAVVGRSELLDLLSVSHRTSPNTYSGEDLHKIPFGLYEIFWKSGGSSLASVGNMHDGVRWIAPINWTSSDSPTGRMDKHADLIERMVLLYGG